MQNELTLAENDKIEESENIFKTYLPILEKSSDLLEELEKKKKFAIWKNLVQEVKKALARIADFDEDEKEMLRGLFMAHNERVKSLR
jgi:hypothetical protein